MKSILVLLVTLVAYGASLLPVAAQEPDRVPVPLPFAVDQTFLIVGTPSPVAGETNNRCGASIAGQWNATAGNERLYATNNPADPCAAVGEDAGPRRFAIPAGDIDTAAFTIVVHPRLPAGLPFVAGEDIKVTFTLVVQSLNPTAPLVVGAVQPNVTLRSAATILGNWDEATPIGADTVQGPNHEGTVYYLTYDVTFTAPARHDGGVLNLTVDLTNTVTKQELRRVATNVGLAIDEAHRGTIRFPFHPDVTRFNDVPEPDPDDETPPDEDAMPTPTSPPEQPDAPVPPTDDGNDTDDANDTTNTSGPPPTANEDTPAPFALLAVAGATLAVVRSRRR